VSDDRFRSYFDIGLIGMAITSVDRGVLEVNAELCRILGYDREELLRTRWSELTHPDDLEADVAAFQRVLDGELDGYRLDKRWIRKDGQVIDSVMAARCTRFADGSVDYFVALVLDTTERRKAERALAESEQRFRLLAESIPHHVWTFRPGVEAGPGRPPELGYWNQRLADYTGLTPEQLRRGGWDALHPDDVAGALVAWQWARAQGSMYEMEQRIRGRDGRYRRFLCRAMPAVDHRGATVEWFGTHSDVEDRRAAEEALQRSQAELAHVARATTVGEFAASLAHEISQPLAAVVLNGTACTRWLAADPPDLREAAEAADRIVHDANRAAEIIQRIRLFLQRGKAERSVLSIVAAVSEILAMVEGQIRQKAIVLDVAFAAALPPVIGDRVQLQQVILNLTMNAIEAMASVAWRKRELAVRVDRHDALSLRVSLRDTGVGLAPDDRERIFEPFHTTKESGMGMGLAISRAIVEAHGGRLWVTANADHGETFQFTLPAAPESLAAVA
jgi:PAS domain S-box-containing protein